MTALSNQSAIASVIVLGFTLACASAPPSGGPPDVPVVRRDTAVSVPAQPGVSPATAIRLNYSTGTFAYDLHQTTVVTVGTDSLGGLQDTLLTTASLTYSVQRPNDTLRIIGVVDSLAVSSARDSTGPRLLLAPVTVELEPDTAAAPMPTTDSTALVGSCDSMEEAARAIARDVLIRLPANTRPHQRWTDSTSVVVCRGGIPMTAVTLSTFEIQDVQPRGDSLIVPIIRRSILTLSGTGTQGARRISVNGTGTSETRFTYELRGGVFLESQGQSVLQLRFETIQQTEQVVQRSMSTVRRRIPGS